MNKVKKVAVVGVLVIVIILVGISFSKTDDGGPVFHVTLADPSLYENGVYTDFFTTGPGRYVFDFVPNGDSPKMLSIQLVGESFSFSEDFILNGTLHKTGISEYYTWDYIGQKGFEIPDNQRIDVKIDPNGNTVGSVSVIINSLE